jgi:hypothetical protein
VTVNGFKKCCVYAAMYAGTLWNGSEEVGDVGSECVQDEAPTVKMETVTLTGKGI